MKDGNRYEAGQRIIVKEYRSEFSGWVGEINLVLADGDFFQVKLDGRKSVVVLSREMVIPAPKGHFERERWTNWKRG